MHIGKWIKLSLYFPTLYIYYVYPAMLKSPKHLPNCLKGAETNGHEYSHTMIDIATCRGRFLVNRYRHTCFIFHPFLVFRNLIKLCRKTPKNPEMISRVIISSVLKWRSSLLWFIFSDFRQWCKCYTTRDCCRCCYQKFWWCYG
jgi:hypothetical protein